MPALTRSARKSTTATPAADEVVTSTTRKAELAELEAELAAIGERQRAAEAAADEQEILASLVRERMLPALIRAARIRLHETELAEVEAGDGGSIARRVGQP